MRHRTLFLVLLIVGTVVTAALTGRLVIADGHNDVSTAREWARLDAFPSSAEDVEVATSGNAFTRTIEVRFEAPAAEISEWLQSSPGTDSTEPTFDGNLRRFNINPGAGANVALVEVDDSLSTVFIQASWS